MSGEPKVTVRGFRQVVQDLLVPELRSIKTEIEYLRKDMDSNSQKIDRLTEITLRLAEKFDASLKYSELSERLARIEEKLNV